MSCSTKMGGKRSKTRRHQKGGNWGSYPDSAWGYQLNNLGGGWTQFMNSLSLQPGENLGTSQSNNIVPRNNLNAQNSQPSLSPKMTGGRRRRHKGHVKRGGNWGAVVEQAAVPLALLAAQQTYGKNKTHKSRSFRQKTRRRRR
jgi:hypothetical protein